MYFRLTPVCFFNAQAKISSTTSREKWSASRTADAAAPAARRAWLARRPTPSTEPTAAISRSYGCASAIRATEASAG